MNNKSRKPTVVPSGDGRTITVLGMKITVKLTSSETGGDCFIFESTTEPGDGVPPHVHSREDEIFDVLEGAYDVLLGEDRFKVTAGTIVYFPRAVVHGFTNSGTTPAKYRIIVTPGTNFEDFIRELSSLPAEMPPDMTAVMEIFDRFGLPIVSPENS